MNNNSTVILCESYPSIAYVLYHLNDKNRTAPLSIFIPALKDLYLFFQDINEKVYNYSLEIIYYPQYKKRWTESRGIKKLWYVIPDIIGERRHLKRFYDEHLARFKDAEIFFPSPGFSGVKIYTLRRLSKGNRLVFIDPGPPYMSRYLPRSLREMVTLLMYKVTYGWNVQLGKYPPDNPWVKGFPLMPQSFMKKFVKSVIDWSNQGIVRGILYYLGAICFYIGTFVFSLALIDLASMLRRISRKK